MKLSLHTSEMKLRGSRFLWLTGSNLSKSTQMNVNGFTSAQNRILQIMLQGVLTYAIKTRLKNGFLVQSFFGNQKKSRTYTLVNSDDPESKKDLVVSYMSVTSDVLSILEMDVSY